MKLQRLGWDHIVKAMHRITIKTIDMSLKPGQEYPKEWPATVREGKLVAWFADAGPQGCDLIHVEIKGEGEQKVFESFERQENDVYNLIDRSYIPPHLFDSNGCYLPQHIPLCIDNLDGWWLNWQKPISYYLYNSTCTAMVEWNFSKISLGSEKKEAEV